MAVSKQARNVGPSVLLMSVLAGALPASALAQESAAQTESTAAAEPTTSSTGVETVVVTAQKRKERLSDVPIAITAVSAAQLQRQGIVSADQLQYVVPELNFVSGPAPVYQIRGIGTQTFTRSSESTVAMVIDGVIQGQPVPPTNSLFDIERVEVLSGPQGMLFGKNASAGVINIVTNAPDPKAMTFDTHIEVGELGHRVVQATANLPVSDNAALRASVFRNKTGDYIDNLASNAQYGRSDSKGARLRYLWKATDKLTVNLSGDYEKRDSTDAPWTVREANGLFGLLQTQCGIVPGPDNLSTCINARNYKDMSSHGGSVQLDYQLGDYTLTSITASRRYREEGSGDSDTLNINILDLNRAQGAVEQFSQELRVASPSRQPLTYVAGLYFYDYKFDHVTDQAGSLGIPALLGANLAASAYMTGVVNQKSIAAFAQGTWNITPQWGLLLGARYTKDKLDSTATTGINPAAGIFVPGFSQLPGTNAASVKNNNVSYRTGAQYKLGPDGLAYMTFARGYKGAAVDNTPGLSGDRIVRPEVPSVVEFGLKNSFFDRRLVTDVSVHHTDFKDFQAQVPVTSNGQTQFQFGNASHLYVKGIQVNFMARPIPALRISGGVGYNDATYGNFIVPCTGSYVSPECAASGTNTMNVKGRNLALTSKLKANLGIAYDRNITDNYRGFVSLDASVRSKSGDATGDQRLSIGGYSIFNGRIGVQTDDGKYSLALYGKNLGDKRFPSLVFNDPLFPANGINQNFPRDAFRTFGITLDVRL